jgi:transcriptional regulator with PAS, ATPase and Fis domain
MDNSKDKLTAINPEGKEKTISVPALESLEQQQNLGATNDMIIFHDLNLNVLWTNQNAAIAVNKTTDQIIGHPCYTSFGINPERSCTDCPVINTIARKEFTSLRKMRQDGKIWDIKSFPVFNKESELIGVVETMTDISQLKDIKNALKDVNKRYEAILLAIPDLVFIINKHGTCLDYYASRPEHLLVPPVMFLNKNIKDVLPETLWMVCKESLDYVMSTGQNKTFSYHLDINQLTCYYEATMVKTTEELSICIIKDITTQKQNEISLHEKIMELEKFNQIMIGRENKMIELKKEINDLRIRLNLPSKYSSPLKSENE